MSEYIVTTIPAIINLPTIQEKEIIPIVPNTAEINLTEALYNEFEADVVKGFGVTPFVLVQLLQNYDAELIRKQIRITKRKRGASPTSNIAGFFVEAVKTDYNDPEEAREAKKQAKIQEIETAKRAAETRKQLLDEQAELQAFVTSNRNNTIRKLVANDSTLTPRAIEYATARIQSDAALLDVFEQRGYEFNALELDHWRLDEFLRHQVLEAMQQLEPKAFVFLGALVARLEELEEEMESLPQPLQRT